MAATGAAVDWLREESCWAAAGRRRARRRTRRRSRRRRRARVPALPGRRAGSSIRRGGPGRVHRADARGRPSRARAGRARGRGVRDAPRRRAAGRGRRADPRAPPGRAANPGDAWARIKADVLGVPVEIPSDRRDRGPRCGDPGRRRRRCGSPDVEAGVAAMTSVDRAGSSPIPSVHARYDELYAVYRDLVPAIAPAVHALGECSAPARSRAPGRTAERRVVGSAQSLRGRVRFPTGGRVPRRGTSPRAATRLSAAGRQIRGAAQAGPTGADGTVRMEEGHGAGGSRPGTCPRTVLPRCARDATEVPMAAASGARPTAAAPSTCRAAPPGAGIRVDDVSLTFRGAAPGPRARRPVARRRRRARSSPSSAPTVAARARSCASSPG